MSEQRCPRCESKRPSSRNLVVYSSDLIMEPCRDEWHDLAAQLAEKDAELLALRAAHAQLREAAQYFADLESCDDPGHDECVGDSGPYCQTHGENNMHVTERDQLRTALAASPPHPEIEGQ